MNELINALVTQLSVTRPQAEGGVASIFKAAQDRLGKQGFDQLLGDVSGIHDVLARAPSSKGGGLLGGLTSMAAKFGGPDMAQAAQLLSAFNALGLSKDTAMQFVPIVLKFLEMQVGPARVTELRAALKI